jgi:hypothetical protein
MMSPLGYEGQLIVSFLKTAPKAFFAEREIARKAGQKGQFRANPDWAKPILFRLANEDIIQTDAFGHYRIAREREEAIPLAPCVEQAVPLAPCVEQAKRRSIALAPCVEQALAGSGKIFDLTEIFADTPKDNIAKALLRTGESVDGVRDPEKQLSF